MFTLVGLILLVDISYACISASCVIPLKNLDAIVTKSFLVIVEV